MTHLSFTEEIIDQVVRLYRVPPDMVEFPTIGERLAGIDLELDNSHCTPPHRDVLDIFIINPRLVLADRGVSRRRAIS